jgi:hypothetical protein
MRRVAAWAAGLLMVGLATVSSSASSTTWTHGYDVSWPQCSGAQSHHMPGGSPRYVVLGLTHGAGHTANPCLADQLAWARGRGTAVGGYLVPSYPTAAQRSAASTGAFGVCTSLRCKLRNDGAAQAADALGVMQRVGLDLPMVWVDVEFRTGPAWSHVDKRNRAVLHGVFRGLRDADMHFGIYTTSYMWDHITGGMKVRVPNWLPAGNGDPAVAKSRCATTGSGGRTWLVQYTREWDENLTCPVMDAVPGRRSPLWSYRYTTLSTGSTGDAVTALQKALDISQSGSYDVATTAAVSQFQIDRSLPVTGSVDIDDWRALGAFEKAGGHPFLLRRMVTR